MTNDDFALSGIKEKSASEEKVDKGSKTSSDGKGSSKEQMKAKKKKPVIGQNEDSSNSEEGST